MQEIKEQVKKVLQYSQGLMNREINIDYHMDMWNDMKVKRFYKALGNQYIYEYPDPVEFHLCEEARNKRLNNFVDYLYDASFSLLGEFIAKNRKTFFENKVSEDYKSPIDNEIIVAGSKLVKAFKHFVLDSQIREHLQNEASRIIQEDKITGTFCISIHPLDYLSSSENNYNWRSCHSLDGDYRSGNLSYMMDSCTLVCYIKGKDDAKLPRFPEDVLWNDKKWRMLLYVSDDDSMLFAGRQYPFAASSILNFITTLLNSCPRKMQWSCWSDRAFETFELDDEGSELRFPGYAKLYPAGYRMLPLREIVIDNEDGQHFNDLLRSSCYIPYYCFKTNGWYSGTNKYFPYNLLESSPKFFVGQKNRCLTCGKSLSGEVDDYMVCQECADKITEGEYADITHCCNCGARLNMFDDEIFMDAEDRVYCSSCAESLDLQVCEYCGRVFFDDEISYNKELGEWRCIMCQNRQ